MDVPEDYREDFTRDLEGNIKDTAGISVVSVSPFIQQRQKLIECVALHQHKYPGVHHPFTVETFTPGGPGAFKWSELVEPYADKGFLGHGETRYRPKINPQEARHCHLDLSLSGDSTGLSCVHRSGYKDVIRRAPDGTEYTEKAPIYTVDFILQIKPPSGEEIVLGDVRQFIYDLSAHGYNITTVTADSYNSADMLQILTRKGYNAELLSVDRTLDPYETLKTALYEGRVLMYEYEPLLDELRKIQKDLIKKKVDHPPGGRKDVADALAGAIFTLSKKGMDDPLSIYKYTPGESDGLDMMMDRPVGGSGSLQPMWTDLNPFITSTSGNSSWGDDD